MTDRDSSPSRAPIDSATILAPVGSGAGSSVMEHRSNCQGTQDTFDSIRERMLLEHSRDGIVVLDESGKVAETNLKFAEMIGYTPSETAELYVWDWDAMFSKSVIEGMLATVDEKGDHFETKHRRKDGSIFDVEISTNGAAINGRKLVFCVCRDISARKSAERQLQMSLSCLRATLEATGAGILVVDCDGKITTFNRRFVEMWQVPKEVLLSNNCGALLALLQDRVVEQEQFLEQFRKMEHYQHASSFDLLHLRSGQAFERHSEPQCVGEEVVGRVWSFHDVSERVESESALRYNEEKHRKSLSQLRVALQAARSGAFAWDLRSNKIEWSDELQALYGLRPGEFNGDFTIWTESLLPEDAADTIGNALKDVERGGGMTNEFRIRRRDTGEVRWLEARGEVVRDSEGQPLFMAGVNTDITERKRAEEELRASEQRLAGILNSQEVYVIRTKLDLEIISVNQAFEQAFGLIPGDNFWTAVHPDDEAAMLAAVREVFNPPYRADIEQRCRVGNEWCSILWHGSLIRDTEGAFVEIQAVGFDITARKRAEEALQESETRLRALVNGHPDHVSIYSADGQILYAHSPAGWRHDTVPEEAAGKCIRDIHPPERAERILGDIRRALATNSLQVSTSAIECGDETNYYEARYSPLGSSTVAAIVRDTTSLRRLELESFKAQKLESVGVLAGGIAHDFNNLLTGILGNLSIALADSHCPAELADCLQESENAAIRAQGLTQQLLTFSKGGKPVRKAMRVDQLLMETVEFSLRGSRVKATFQMAPDLQCVEGDASQLSQAIQNLSLNAVQAMSDGGLLQISAENVTIDATAGLPILPGRYLQITLQDHGEGIPEHILPRIFDPYFTTKERGSGLGLASTLSIVTNHDGWICAQSEIGAGSTFRIYLPAAAKEQPAEPTTEWKARKLTGRILIMDDEEIIRSVSSRILRRAGFSVDYAAESESAIKLFVQSVESGCPYDTVILDLTIPGGKGGESVLKELISIQPSLKAIACSGYSDSAVAASFQEHGFHGFIAKPFSSRDLVTAVQSVIEAVSTTQTTVATHADR